MKNADKPAYPRITEERTSQYAEVPDSMIESSECLTAREMFCLHAGIPETGDPDLDDIIRKSERKKLATAAMQGLLANKYMGTYLSHEIVAKAIHHADELLKQLQE